MFGESVTRYIDLTNLLVIMNGFTEVFLIKQGKKIHMYKSRQFCQETVDVEFTLQLYTS